MYVIVSKPPVVYVLVTTSKVLVRRSCSPTSSLHTLVYTWWTTFEGLSIPAPSPPPLLSHPTVSRTQSVVLVPTMSIMVVTLWNLLDSFYTRRSQVPGEWNMAAVTVEILQGLIEVKVIVYVLTRIYIQVNNLW